MHSCFAFCVTLRKSQLTLACHSHQHTPHTHPPQLEQQFPPSQSPEVQTQHCINLGKHYLSDLCFHAPTPANATMRTYPLIVRLEALTDEGRVEQRSLEGLEPGCELPHWVQSQVRVFACEFLSVSVSCVSSCVSVCVSCLSVCVRSFICALEALNTD